MMHDWTFYKQICIWYKFGTIINVKKREFIKIDWKTCRTVIGSVFNFWFKVKTLGKNLPKVKNQK
jgi:hypothetical protein